MTKLETIAKKLFKRWSKNDDRDCNGIQLAGLEEGEFECINVFAAEGKVWISFNDAAGQQDVQQLEDLF